MSDIAETISPLGVDVNYRQAIMPNHQYGSFVANDTDNHDFIVHARGKRTVTISVDNPANQDCTWSLYGMHESDGKVGDVGTFEVDMDNAVASVNKNTATNTVSFPFYLIRVAFAVAPSDEPAESVSVYADLMGN